MRTRGGRRGRLGVDRQASIVRVPTTCCAAWVSKRGNEDTTTTQRQWAGGLCAWGRGGSNQMRTMSGQAAGTSARSSWAAQLRQAGRPWLVMREAPGARGAARATRAVPVPRATSHCAGRTLATRRAIAPGCTSRAQGCAMTLPRPWPDLGEGGGRIGVEGDGEGEGRAHLRHERVQVARRTLSGAARRGQAER